MSAKARMHKSDSQANAEALARRSASYADENARTMEVKFDRRRYRPTRLRDLVRQLRRAYADEVPIRIHVHDLDAGGAPEWSKGFERYLDAGDDSTDGQDNYLTPIRAALTSWGDAERRRLVGAVVIGGQDAGTAAIILGVPEWCANDVAFRALDVFWTRWSDIRLDLRRTETAA